MGSSNRSLLERTPSTGDTTAVAELDNLGIAEQLEGLAALLDLSGAGYYSVRAYRRRGRSNVEGGVIV